MKIVITAGGGGHFAPALAVLKKLQEDKTNSILYIGRKHALEGDSAVSLEYQTVKSRGIPFRTITAGRLQRSISIRSCISLAKIPVGFMQAFTILKQEKPAIVLSFGGYIALPVTVAAGVLGIPVVIHEQTMKAGLANRIAGKFASAICLSFASSQKLFPAGKTVITGNPLRETVVHPKQSKKYFHENKPIIFVTGGSLGAHAINTLIEGCLEKLLEKYQIIHQTGNAQEYDDASRLESKKSALPELLKNRYEIMRFIEPDEIGGILKQASLVVGRAGMSTVTELIYSQKPALLIPLPHGQKNEQLENAEYLVSLGLARVKNQEELTPETMYTEIVAMMEELGSYRLNRDVHSLIQEDAAEKIIATLFSITQKLRPQAEEEKKS